jgi:hypothetical protein
MWLFRSVNTEHAGDQELRAILSQMKGAIFERVGALDGIAILHWTGAKIPVGIHTHMAPVASTCCG